MKTNKDISEETYLRFVAANVLGWTNDEKALVESALLDLRPRLTALSLSWPETIYLVKTTGNEEGGAAYTRGNAIVFPHTVLAQGHKESLRKTISHELFHILTRNNAVLKEKLYAAIGFQRCGEVAFPSKLKAIKITNPDAPKNDHCIRLRVADTPAWAVPILFSRTAKYDASRGGEFFHYMQFQFLLVEGKDAAVPSTVTYDDANFRLVGVNRVAGFFEQVGRNTDYIIHPEEILADNFSLLIRGEESIPSPEVIKKMREALEQARIAQPVVPASRPQAGVR